MYSDFSIRGTPLSSDVLNSLKYEDTNDNDDKLNKLSNTTSKYTYPPISTVYEWTQVHNKLYSTSKSTNFSESFSLNELAHQIISSTIPQLADKNKAALLLPICYQTLPYLFHHGTNKLLKDQVDDREKQYILYISLLSDVLLFYKVEEIVNDFRLLGIIDFLFALMDLYLSFNINNQRIHLPKKLKKRLKVISANESLEFTFPMFRVRCLNKLSNVINNDDTLKDYLRARDILKSIDYDFPNLPNKVYYMNDMLKAIEKSFNGLEFIDEKEQYHV